MKEDFLYYVWQYKKFNSLELKTYQGEKLAILNSGTFLQNQGPDFFNALIEINHQKWAGNIEIHVKSSDWFLHNHQEDNNYNNVILHVVWQHDAPVYSKNNEEIPVLVLKDFVDENLIENYLQLTTTKTWIYCENQIKYIDNFILQNLQEKLYIERLEQKSDVINNLLKQSNNDWEAVLFTMLCKNFGLNTNGDHFYFIAQSIPFNVIRKESSQTILLESLLFGQANMLPEIAEDNYVKNLISNYEFLTTKHNLQKPAIGNVQFFKHRPDNFPTIRLSQLSVLYNTHQNLFSKIIEVKSIKEIYSLFNISVSDYWKNHHHFDKESAKKEKFLSKSFIDLLRINTLIPIKFCYDKEQKKDYGEYFLDIIKEVSAEKNTIISKFNFYGIKSYNALQTQSLLQLKSKYCNLKKCINCAIGLEILKNNL